MKLRERYSLGTLIIGLLIFLFLLARETWHRFVEFWREPMFVRSTHKADAAAPRNTTKITGSLCQLSVCTREIPRGHLMCREHWFEVPEDLRHQVEGSLKAWLGHQTTVQPYLIARLRAIIHVATKHGIAVHEEQAKLTRLLDAVK